MLAKILSFGLLGLDAYPITIEVDVTRGLPATTIVGLPDNAIRESKERVRSAIKNSGFKFPADRITINLSPADIKKEGPSFDLAIALGILAASEQIPEETLQRFAFLGELSLDGRIQPIKGALSISLNADANTLKGIILPTFNAKEASFNDSIPIYMAESIDEVVHIINNTEFMEQKRSAIQTFSSTELTYDMDFSDVKGQLHVKRGMEIAAAGGHNLILVGTQYNRWNLRWWRPCRITHNQHIGTVTRRDEP